MLAILRLLEPLQGANFRVWKQTRTGLLSYPLDLPAARAHLAASIYVQMALKPHIIHVVGHTEADHAATPTDVIEACKMATRVIENALKGAPDMTQDVAVQQRVSDLTAEAIVTLRAIRELAPAGVADPLADAATLAKAVKLGILDAPQLRNNPFAKGTIQTRILNGACCAVDEEGQALSEAERLAGLH
jgi:hypothetical protein